jgi:hypothetical protein
MAPPDPNLLARLSLGQLDDLFSKTLTTPGLNDAVGVPTHGFAAEAPLAGDGARNTRQQTIKLALQLFYQTRSV